MKNKVISTLITMILLSYVLHGQSRIIGGQYIDIVDVPWQVSLQSGGVHFCGASIISDKWLLTAAHCVIGMNAADIHIHAGATDYNNTTEGVFVACDRYIIHPQYDMYTHDNDIALLHLSAPLNFNDCIQNIKLNDDVSNNDIAVSAILTGWGATFSSTSPNLSRKLQYVVMPIISKHDAIMIDYRYHALTENMLPFYSNGKGAAQGDSGGPAVVHDGTKYVLVGVSSWGAFPKDQTPTVYTKVSNYIDWILKNSIFTDITLTGPTQICNSTGTFILKNLPAGASVQWSTGGGRWDALELTSGQGTAQATYSTTGNGQGTVQATVNYLGASITLSQAVWAGAPSAELSVNGDGIARASACLRTDPLTMHAEPPVWQLWNPSQQVNFVEDDDGRCGRVRGAAGDWNIRGTVTVRNGCGEATGRFSMSGTSQTDPCPRLIEQRGSGSNLTVMYNKPIDCPVWPIRGVVDDQPIMEVYDRMGRLLLRHQGEQVSLGSLRPGLYIVRARSGEDVATLTVVRE